MTEPLRFRLPGHMAAEWSAANPVLIDRTMGIETDTRRAKYGDGVTAWNDLPYASPGPITAAMVTAALGFTPAASGANTDITSITGSAARLTTPRTLSATGDVSWSVTFDGSGGVSGAATLATVPVAKGGTGSTTAAGARATLGAAPTVSPAFTGTAAFEEAGFASSRLTGTNSHLLFQYAKNSGQGATVAFRRPTASSQCLIGLETGSANTPDGYFGTISGFAERLFFLGGTGNAGKASFAIDSSLGLIVGSGLIPSVAASISGNGAGVFSSVRPGSFTVATVPAPSLGAGTTIYVSNESGGAVLAFSDGSTWRRVTDRAAIS